MTKAVFAFLICLGIYFVALAIFAIIKKIKAKKAFKKRKEEEEMKGGVNYESEDKN